MRLKRIVEIPDLKEDEEFKYNKIEDDDQPMLKHITEAEKNEEGTIEYSSNFIQKGAEEMS